MNIKLRCHPERSDRFALAKRSRSRRIPGSLAAPRTQTGIRTMLAARRRFLDEAPELRKDTGSFDCVGRFANRESAHSAQDDMVVS
jgi:hypothetical protein